MGKIKNLQIVEEDLREAANRRPASVSGGGGDAMTGMNAIFDLMGAEAAKADAAEHEVFAALSVADQADKELDRDMALVSTLPAPPDDTVVSSALVFDMPPQAYMKKGQHYNLVFTGVATHCAHCAMALTDPVSIERSLGPSCSKRGYMEDPKDSDEIQAMIDLAEYPTLVEYLVAKYKPLGVRGLMKGMVNIASLNRRSPVHQAITDAIDSLGYKKLASLLRESLCAVEIKEHDANNWLVWVKKSEWSWSWSNDLRRNIPNSYMSRKDKGMIVPKSGKQMLWALVLKNYAGMFAKVPDGSGGKKAVKIQEKTMAPPASSPQMVPTT